MDKYSEVEKRLRNLDIDKIYLQSLEKDLQILELEYSIRGVNFDGVGGGSGISDTTGDTAIRLMDEKKDLELRIARTRNKIEHIDNILNNLTETENRVVVLFYIEHKPFWKIAKEVDYSPTQIKRIKKDAMDKVIRGIYGED